MAKKVDPLKAKQRKQKILAAVLGVVFLAVMGFQVPRVMKMMKTPPAIAWTTCLISTYREAHLKPARRTITP